MTWPTIEQTATRLQAEAMALCRKLGHAMTGWTHLVARRSAARCMGCQAMAWVYVRVPNEAPIQGDATQLHCKIG
jgi:hypothetical protein